MILEKLIRFIVRLKFQKRSTLKFVSRTIPHSGGYDIPRLAVGFIPAIIKKISGRGTAKLLLLILMMALISTLLISCKKEKKVEKENLINVRVQLAEKKKVQPYLETTGTLNADEEVSVSSEVDGIVRQLKVEEGSLVNRGSLLVEINDVDYTLDLKRSEAASKQTEANLDNAQAEYKRQEALYKEELVTKQQFDDITTKVALAKAALEGAKATLAISREKLTRTKVYSPLNGAVKEKKISVGDYVRNGTPLLQLIRVNPLKLNFTVSEKDAASIKIGQEVAFSVDAYPAKQFKGRVNLLYPHVEEKTRTLQAEALVPNSDRLLKPGFFVRTLIYTEAPREVILAPITALLYDNSVIRVFVADGNKARERILKIGGKYGEFVEVLEGLKEKEQIVVVGQNNLSEGVKVNVAR
jgi:RND family efflux transporter MFP subunit